jgi:hypothetical protein
LFHSLIEVLLIQWGLKHVEPQLEDFSDSSSTQNDADVILALFDPLRYKVDDTSGYDLDKLVDGNGAKYYRSVRLIKTLMRRWY